MRMRVLVTAFAAFSVSAYGSFAGALVYQPVNPAFGGSPLNGSWQLSQAQAQNQYTNSGKSSALSSALTPGQIFASQLTSQLYGSLANQITEALFGANAQQSGTYTLAGTTISFVRVGGEIQIAINDGTSVTNITVPAAP
ncbi:curli assembly protein CsgF [Rhizobium sp. S152]|uniref:curli production assembly/transport component CsgF n=1 Tax=Rhizobium sp. S152 TaxID=3055038 RepID=UPI0025A93AED|nr:curli production assembly/transport component CsgF [Rhizobium sp. S152]MDM9628958.1 curli assembly protein CsgF [Rhizobium sp. S152]